MIKAYKFFKKYFKFKSKIFLYIFCSFGSKVSTLSIPYLTKKLIDSIEFSNLYNFKLTSFLLILMMILFSIFLSNAYYLGNSIEVSVLNNLKEDMLTRIFDIKSEKIKNLSAGEFIQKIFNDTEIVRPLIISTYVDIILNSIYSFAIIVIMFSMNKIITILLLFLVPIFILFYKIYIPRIEKINSKIIEKDENIKSLAEEILTGNIDIKINNASKFMELKVKSKLKQYLVSVLCKIRYFKQYDYILITGIMNLATLLIYCFGGYLVFKSIISIGTLISFTLYFSRLWDPVEYFMGLSKDLKIQLISLKRIQSFFDIECEEKNINNLLPPFNSLNLQDVNFAHYNDRIIFKNLNLVISARDKIGIRGGNGTGKSTFANIITKLIDTYQGNIYYNNLNYDSLDSRSIREKIVLIPSNIYLFNGSIAENIALQIDNADKLVTDFVKKANAEPLLNILINNKRNLNTIVNNQTNNLSGGERKIVQILRGLFVDGDVYILDEPFNYIDKTYKQILIDFIKNNLTSKTVIIISHDEEIFECCNKIYNLDKNTISLDNKFSDLKS